MDHKERTMLAIRHQSPDRVPVDWTARPEVSDALMQHLGIRDYDALLEYLEVDIRYIQPIEVIYDRKRYVGPALKTFGDGSWEDIWGVRRRRVSVSTSIYDDVGFSPLQQATTVDEVAAHR